jgi:hypothetical protein
MSGAIPPLPNTPSWRRAQLKHRDNFTLHNYIKIYNIIQNHIPRKTFFPSSRRTHISEWWRTSSLPGVKFTSKFILIKSQANLSRCTVPPSGLNKISADAISRGSSILEGGGSSDSIVTSLTGLTTGVRFPAGAENLSPRHRCVLGPTKPLTQWVPGPLSPGVRWPGRKAEQSPPSAAEVKNAWNHTYIAP